MRASMVLTYNIKLFRTGADRHNGILISLLLLVAVAINLRSLRAAMDCYSNLQIYLGQIGGHHPPHMFYK